MIKFSATDEDGKQIVGLGLHTKNLERIKEGDPIVFPCKDAGLDDDRLVSIYYLPEKAEPNPDLSEKYAIIIPMGDEGIEYLKQGNFCRSEVVEGVLEIVVFHCDDPDAFYDQMAHSGLIHNGTILKGIDSSRKPPSLN